MPEETEQLITSEEIEPLDKLFNAPIFDDEDLIKLAEDFPEDE